MIICVFVDFYFMLRRIQLCIIRTILRVLSFNGSFLFSSLSINIQETRVFLFFFFFFLHFASCNYLFLSK